jgi:hypothetical protein
MAKSPPERGSLSLSDLWWPEMILAGGAQDASFYQASSYPGGAGGGCRGKTLWR